jgi:hypothetical protein
MSALASPRRHTLAKPLQSPGASCARQRMIPLDHDAQLKISGRIWLYDKLVTPCASDLDLETVDIKALADWADGTCDIDWMVPVFWGIARGFKNVVVGEIGMRYAISTLAFALAARDVGGKVYSIDIDECIEGRRTMAHAGLDGYHTFIHGDSGAVEFPEELDVLFIDGDHSYQGVSLDFNAHIGRVKKGGVVLFHDSESSPDVRRFCEEVGATNLPMGAGLGVLGC